MVLIMIDPSCFIWMLEPVFFKILPNVILGEYIASLDEISDARNVPITSKATSGCLFIPT